MTQRYEEALDCWSDACNACDAAREDLDNCELAVEISRFTLELAEQENDDDD